MHPQKEKTSEEPVHASHPRPLRAEDVADGITVAIRFAFGIVFGFVFASKGYGLGSIVWSGFGLLMAIFAFPVGFITGFFFVELKAVFHLIMGFWLD